MENKFKIIILTFLLSFVGLFGCKKSTSKNKTSEKIEEKQSFLKDVNAVEFKKIIEQDNVIILDVRRQEEVAKGHIKGCSNIDFYSDDLIDKINLIDKSKAIAVYCRSGGRSSKVAKLLQENGFNEIYQLLGGVMAWENEGFPLIKSETPKDEHIKTLSLTDFEKVLKTNELVLIDFHTVWCAPCRKMAPIIDEIEKEYKGKAVVMRIDVDNSKEVAKKYNVRAVPVFVLYKNGVEKWKHNGIISKKELIHQINNKF